MRQQLLLLQLLAITIFSVSGQTPLSMNGKLKLVGNQLSNACGDPVQLRGLSTHAPMGHQDCYTQSSVEAMANDWGSDIIRLAMYTDVDNGTDYLDNPTVWNNWIDQMVDYAEDYGMYVMIDWHILKDNDPMTHVDEAKTFFATMSDRYKDRDHVLYEICNEPNGWVDWNRIKEYANEIIPIIRANDPENIIIVGTPQWSSRPGDVWQNPLSSANSHNVMYSFHFYAGSHYDYGYLQNVLGSLPVFVTEWGTTDASGNGGFNSGSSDTWLSVLDGNNNGGQLVSSCNWTFSDKNESSAALNPGACVANEWLNRTQSGNYVFNYISSSDNFTQCEAVGDDDGDGVINANDLCPNTPSGNNVDANGCTAPLVDSDGDGIDDNDDECPGTPANTTVNLYGCEIVHTFVNNSCYGVNNYQGYARDDFEQPHYENMTWWATDGTSDVYDAGVSGGEMVVDITDADPDYTTFGMSFDEDDDGNLVTIDISHHPVLTMDVYFEPDGSYSSGSVLLEVHITDDADLELSTDALQNLHRETIPVNQWTTVTMDFTDGYYESYTAADCPGGTTPCYLNNGTFDYSRLTKVQMWVNPGAGEAWSRPAYNGTWRIDNFSVGYDNTSTEACDPFRDDDGDGIAVEEDLCPATPINETANASGCSASQLDTDNDGVNNLQDACSNTAPGAIVDASGCSDAQRDDDGDGVLNPNDLCESTPIDETVNTDGCSASQLDDDNDGVVNTEDVCPGEDDTINDDTDDIPNGCDNCPAIANNNQEDTDSDNIGDLCDNCPDDANTNQLDSDNDGYGDACDICAAGDDDLDLDNDNIPDACDNDDDGDGVTDDVDCDDRDENIGIAATWYEDTDEDGYGDSNSSITSCTQPTGYVDNAQDQCVDDINKITPGECGCGVEEGSCDDCAGVPNGNAVLDDCDKCIGGTTGETSDDADEDGTLDCNDQCPNDPNKTIPGSCGCGVEEGTCTDCAGVPNGDATRDACDKCVGGTTGETSDDADNDGTLDCNDQCPDDANKTVPGDCGCGIEEGTCQDCADVPFGNATVDACGKCIGGTTGETSDDADDDGVLDCNDECPNTFPGTNVNERGCLVTGISGGLNNNVKVYPVPTEDKLTIAQNKLTFTSATVIDVAGNVVATYELTTIEEQVSLKSLAAGLYFIELSGEETTIVKIQVQ